MSPEPGVARVPQQPLLFGRFEVLEELGSGGFGRVLRCTDVESQEIVAVKELHRFGADALLRFKKEFRVLADVQHPNLVRFGELFEGEGRWGFSLEFVRGSDALHWVGAADNDSEVDSDRVRQLVLELVHGLSALHALGVLHRDIKPENIRVTPEGRVVLLDFGLATHLAGGEQTSEATAIGTVAYMAPEQANAQKLTPAADWYSLGVLLYEVLTGQLPFQGAPLNILMAKHHGPSLLPSQCRHGIAPDLEAICLGLLKPKVEERLDGEGILALLGERSGASSLATRSGHRRREELFVGRQRELNELEARLSQAANEGIAMVLVEGESGIGKSALAHHFAERVSEHGKARTFAGRCHAAEQVGYKAFDGVVDDLSRYLKALPTSECRALLPDDAHLLTVLFPVLDRVPAILRAKRQRPAGMVERYPLFRAFLELLGRIGEDHPFVFVIDDVQWADEASLVLLRALLESARAPRLLVLATVRPLETLDDGIGEGLRSLSTHARARRVRLGPLDEADSRTLIGRLTHTPTDAALAERILRDAGGHPLFLNELLRHVQESESEGAESGLDSAIETRVARLDWTARAVLELSSVAGAPLPHSVLRAAVATHPESFAAALAVLRSQKLLRLVRRQETVVYHDRIREAVLRVLPTEAVAAHHRCLADAWTLERNAEPARLSHHWLSCGMHERAAPCLEQAAKKAEQGGAFERAAEHYLALLSLEGVSLERSHVHSLRLSLSDALAAAGHCAESARMLLRALEGATDEEAVELTIRAAQRLLQAAEIAEGLAAAKQAFALVGLPWPEGKLNLLVRTAWNRCWIAVRGSAAQDTEPSAVPAQQQRQLDALLRFLSPLAWADFLRSVEATSRHARHALAWQAPDHAAYALCMEGVMHVLEGASAEAVAKIFDRARSWRERADGPALQAWELHQRAWCRFALGDAREAERHAMEAERIYTTACPGALWEHGLARAYLLSIWAARGKWKRFAESTEAWLAEADLRGDRSARAMYLVAGQGCLRHVLEDAPDRSREELRAAMEPWRVESAGAFELMETGTLAALTLYPGGGDAKALWAERWPRLERTMLFRMPVLREGLLEARVRTLLTAAFEGDEESARYVRRWARTLAKGRSAWAKQMGLFTRAQVAWLDGDREQTYALASAAAAVLDRGGLDLVADSAALLAARAENAADADEREQRFLERLAKEGFARPDKAIVALLPAARVWRA